MKKSITLAALLLALGTSVFAYAPAKSTAHISIAEVSFVSMQSDNEFAVKIAKPDAGKTTIQFFDQDNNVIFTDVLTKGTDAEKGYIISDLDNGDYTVKVTSNNEVVKKHLHVYNDEDTKSYVFID